MPNYIHIPIPSYAANNLKITFGEDEYYYQTRLSTQTDANFVATTFADVNLEGFEDWEIVYFGVMWERLGNEGNYDWINIDRYGSYYDSHDSNANGYFSSEPKPGYDDAFTDSQIWPGIDTTSNLAEDEYFGHSTGSSSGYGVFNIDAQGRSVFGQWRGKNADRATDGNTGWEGYTKGFYSYDGIGTAADYSNNGGDFWSLEIPQVPAPWSALYVWGPGKYVRDFVQKDLAFVKATNNREFAANDYSSSEVKFKFFMRTESLDTVYSEERTLYDSRRGVGPARLSADWPFNKGEDLPAVISDNVDTNGIINTITYPEISQVELTYPISYKLGPENDDTEIGFIYRGRKIALPNTWDDTQFGVTEIGSTAVAEPVIVAGKIVFIRVTSGGHGYMSTPTVTITGGGSGAGATATAEITFGQVHYVTVDDQGSGYTTPIEVSFSGGAGDGAAATATIASDGTVSGITVTAGGADYTSAPGVTIAYGGGSSATATATITSGSVTSITVTNAGSGYDQPTVVSFSDGGIGGFSANQFTGFTTTEWNNNSALCAWDFISNKRFGMGNMFKDIATTTSTQYDLITNDIYNAAQRCQQATRLADGTTNKEMRYSCNVVIDGNQTKLETLSQLLSNFHAKYFFHDGFMRVYQDRPERITKIVNQTNASNFNYAGSTDRTRTNTVFVKFNNPAKLFKQDVAFAEDRTALEPPAPIISKEVVGFGITSRGQAVRHGRWIIEEEAVSEQIVTYIAGFDHAFVKPGDLLLITDSAYDGVRYGGRIKKHTYANNTSSAVLEFDDPLDWTPDATKAYYIYFQNGQHYLSSGTKHYPRTLQATVSSWNDIGGVGPKTGANLVVWEYAYQQDPHQRDTTRESFEGMPFVICEAGTERIYRVERKVEGEHPFEYEITASTYSNTKFNNIDQGFEFGFGFETDFPGQYMEDAQ